MGSVEKYVDNRLTGSSNNEKSWETRWLQMHRLSKSALIEDSRSVGAKSCIRTRLTCVLEHSLALSRIEEGGGLCCHSVTIERRLRGIANF